MARKENMIRQEVSYSKLMDMLTWVEQGAKCENCEVGEDCGQIAECKTKWFEHLVAGFPKATGRQDE